MSFQVGRAQKSIYPATVTTQARHQNEKNTEPEWQSLDLLTHLPDNLRGELAFWILAGNLSGDDLRSLACTNLVWNEDVKIFLMSDKAESIYAPGKVNSMLECFQKKEIAQVEYKIEDGDDKRDFFNKYVSKFSEHGWPALLVKRYPLSTNNHALLNFKSYQGTSLMLSVRNNHQEIRNVKSIAHVLPRNIFLRLLFCFPPTLQDPKMLRALFWNLRSTRRPIGISIGPFNATSAPGLHDVILDQMRGKLWLTDLQFMNVRNDAHDLLRKLADIISEIRYVKMVTIVPENSPQKSDITMLAAALKNRLEHKKPKVFVVIEMQRSPAEGLTSSWPVSDAVRAEVEAYGLVFIDAIASEESKRIEFLRLRELLSSDNFEPYTGLTRDADEDSADYDSEVEWAGTDDSDDHSTDADSEVKRNTADHINTRSHEGKSSSEKNTCVVS